MGQENTFIITRVLNNDMHEKNSLHIFQISESAPHLDLDAILAHLVL